MKTLCYLCRVAKIPFALLFIIVSSGCVHHTVVPVQPVSHGHHSKIFISSNPAYYERYGYPIAHKKPYYQPKTVVVKKVKVVPVHSVNSRHNHNYYESNRKHSHVYPKPHNSKVNHVHIYEKKRHNNMPIKRYEKPKRVEVHKRTRTHPQTQPHKVAHAKKQSSPRSKSTKQQHSDEDTPSRERRRHAESHHRD